MDAHRHNRPTYGELVTPRPGTPILFCTLRCLRNNPRTHGIAGFFRDGKYWSSDAADWWSAHEVISWCLSQEERPRELDSSHCATNQSKESCEAIKAPQDLPRFPTMLRKMWSGREVQDWIDTNIAPCIQSRRRAIALDPALGRAFPDGSDADPLTKARRFLQALSEPGDETYFHDDGHRRKELALAARATLAVFGALSGQIGPRAQDHQG